MSDTILFGSFVHLKNKKLGYLDSCGYVQNEPHFAQYPGNIVVQTSNLPNRDHWSGTWKIESATGKEDWEPILSTDLIRLRNCYPDAGYLSLFSETAMEDTDVLRQTSPGFFDGSYVFTADAKKRLSNAIFSLVPFPEQDIDTPVAITINSAVKIVGMRGSSDPANPDSLAELPKEFPAVMYGQYLQAFGPQEKLDMLKLRYPAVQTGLVFSAYTPSSDPEYQVWEISRAELPV